MRGDPCQPLGHAAQMPESCPTLSSEDSPWSPGHEGQFRVDRIIKLVPGGKHLNPYRLVLKQKFPGLLRSIRVRYEDPKCSVFATVEVGPVEILSYIFMETPYLFIDGHAGILTTHLSFYLKG